MKNLKQKIKNNWTKIFSIFLFLMLLGAYSNIFAIPPATKYNPGEIRDPDCSPGDPNCSVEIGGGSGWSLTGNSGTSIGTNFIGTTDDIDLQFRRNNIISGQIGTSNTSYGLYSLSSNTAGELNSAFGAGSLLSNTTGNYNSAFGMASLGLNTTGDLNSAFGFNSLIGDTTGYGNSAFGAQSLSANTTGYGNSALGYVSGLFAGLIQTANRTSSLSVYLGSNTRASSDGDVNEIVIGANAIGNGSDTATIGDSNLLRTYLTGLNLKAGTAGAGTAPLKFNSGTLLGTPETGAIEFDGTHYYGTIGSTRYQLDQQDGGLLSDADYNTVGGTDAGLNLATGAQENTFLGYQAGLGGVMTNAADYNTAIGSQSLFSNTTGHDNTGVGAYAFYYNTTGYNNTATGSSALAFNTTGHDNVAVGAYNLYYNNTGNDNTSIGSLALQKNTSGIENTAIGSNSLFTNTTSSFNTAVGAYTLPISTGEDNTAIGDVVLNRNTTGSRNTGLGSLSLYYTTTGNSNTAGGFQSLYNNTTGSNNVALGIDAGHFQADGITALTDPENSIYIGPFTKGLNNTDSNSIVIGYNTISNGPNTTTIGNTSTLRTYLTGLNLKAGTATAGTAPLKFNSGTLLGTPETGAIEFDGTHYYGTIGSTRYQLDQQGGGGLLSDADFNTKGGTDAGLNLVAGAQNNTFLGYQAGKGGVVTNAADGNTGIGYSSLYSNTTGNNNTASGFNSLASNTTGNSNTATGSGSLLFNTTGTSNTATGSNSLPSNTTGSQNTANGFYSLRYNATGLNNTAIGYESIAYNTTGSRNTALGYSSLSLNKTGSNGVAIGVESQYYANDTLTPWTNTNTSVGYQSLRGSTTAANNTGNSNTALGYQSLLSNSTGVSNSAHGFKSLYSNTTGNYNTTQGSSSMFSNTTGYENTAQGYNSLYSNTTGNDNSAQGIFSLFSNTTGNNNSAQGYSSLFLNTTGGENTAQGMGSLSSNSTGSRNSAQGYNSLSGNTIGSDNSAIGYFAGSYIADGLTFNTSSDYSIYLGADTKALADDGQNEIVIGFNTIGNGSNTATIGNTSLLRTYLTGVNLKAGTATAGTAPLKFNSGTLLGTPETGAIEFDGTHYYGTIGSTRYQLDQQGGGLLSDADFNTKGGTDAGLNLVAGAQNNTFLGYQAGRGGAMTNEADFNTAIGGSSFSSNTTGNMNSALGYQTLGLNTTGSQNSSLGYSSLYNNNTGNHNSAFGYETLYSNTSGNYNSALGYASSFSNTIGSSNSSLGGFSLYLNTTGSSNSSLGNSSLMSNTVGNNNTALSYSSLYSNKAGSNGVAIGYGSQSYANDTTTPWTNYNTSVGYQSLRGSTTAASNTGNYNTAIGYDSLLNNSTGGSNSALGYYSLYSNTTGSSNIGLGYQAGRYVNSSTSPNEISNNSIYIGYDTQALANGDTNEIVIGHQALGHGSNTAQWGNTSMTNHYFSGSIQFSTYGAGTLTTDASGNITASSDERLKNIEGDFNNEGNALDIINSINPILYKWNDTSGFDQTTIYAGFSAQNIKDLIPEAVGTDPKGYLTLSDRPILATAINAIKELDLKVKALNEEIKSMTLGEMIKDFIENEANRFEKIFAKTVVTEGIEMKDTATGEDYCVVITNGEFEKVKGKCGEPIEDMSADNSSDSDESSSSDVAQDEESELGSDVGTEEGTIEQTEVPTEEGSLTTNEEEASVDSPIIPSEEISTNNTTTTTESVPEGQ